MITQCSHRRKEQLSATPQPSFSTPEQALSPCTAEYHTYDMHWNRNPGSLPRPWQEQGQAAQARRKCHPARTQRLRWYLAAGSVNHAPGKTYLAIPGPDSSTESLGERWFCAQSRRGANPSFPKTMEFGGDIGSGPGGIHRAAGDGRAKTLQQPVPTVNELTGLIKKGCVQCSACIRKGWGQGRAQRPPLGWGPMFFIFRSVQYKAQVSEIWCDFIPRYFYSKLKAASNGENKPPRVCLVNLWEQRRHLQHIGDVRAWPKAASREIHCRITRSAQSTEQGHEIFPLRNPCPTEGNNETLIACREKGNNSSVCSAGREGTLPGVQPIQPVINTL